MKLDTIASIMTKNVVSVSPQQKIIDIKHIYEKEKFHRHIPVIENNKLVGMISLIDFMYHIKGAGLDDKNTVYNELLVKDIMTQKPNFYSPDTPIKEVAQNLTKGDYHALPIIDNHHLVGIVSTIDVIQYYLDKHK
jgi:acetoin utilization protein AcuB